MRKLLAAKRQHRNMSLLLMTGKGNSSVLWFPNGVTGKESLNENKINKVSKLFWKKACPHPLTKFL